MSLARSETRAQPHSRFRLDPIGVALLCVFAAAGAAAFATAVSPHGYRQLSRLAGALLLGLLVSLLVRLALRLLLVRRFAVAPAPAAYAATAAAFLLLLTAAAARTLLPATGTSAPTSGGSSAQQAFERWTQQAVPLLVRYKDTLAADASPAATAPGGGISLAHVERARRQLIALEPAVRHVARIAPPDLRPFTPRLIRAVTLAAAAQARYEAALATRGAHARQLRRQADGLLRRSQQAMAAFSFAVNGVGGRLTGG